MAQKKKLTKQRARESLESQIDLSQREAKKELIKGRKVESYKNQVFFLEFQKKVRMFRTRRSPKCCFSAIESQKGLEAIA